MTTAMAIWLVGVLPAMAQEARLRVNIFAGPQNVNPEKYLDLSYYQRAMAGL
jgi:hypothetical protein